MYLYYSNAQYISSRNSNWTSYEYNTIYGVYI